MKSLLAVFALGLAAFIVATALAQDETPKGKTLIIETAPQDAPAPKPPEQPKVPPLQKVEGEMREAALAQDLFVSVKDLGEAQTVLVFKLDDSGVMQLTHKAKFLYNAPAAPPAKPSAPENTTRVEGKISVTALSTDTFITLKDHGFAQTAMTYKLDPTGKVRLVSRQTFIY